MSDLTEELKKRSAWSIFMGVLTAALGVFLIIYPLATATITTVRIIGDEDDEDDEVEHRDDEEEGDEDEEGDDPLTAIRNEQIVVRKILQVFLCCTVARSLFGSSSH